MGWESGLNIDGNLVGIWRKHVPDLPALLFHATDVVITPHAADAHEDDHDSVVWTTTAAKAMENLTSSGFSWAHLLRDYAESRDFSLKVVFLQCALRASMGNAEYDALIATLNAHDPAEDLRLLGLTLITEMRALTASWSADLLQEHPPTPIRDLLLFHNGEDSPLIDVGEDLPSDVRLILTRAADYFVRSTHSAPLVGWAFTVVELLQHTDPSVIVEFDISGGLPESSCHSSTEYAEQYWKSARSALADTARFYGSVFAGLATATTDFARAAQYGRLETLLADAEAPDINNIQKGHRLEELVAALLELPDTRLPVLEKRLKHADEELDLVLRNDLEGAFWRSFTSPLLLVECKNWSSRVDINELRVLETKMRDRHRLCSVGLFVALNGFSRPFLDRCRELQLQGLTVFPIDGADIREILTLKQTLPQWLSDNGLRRIL